MNCVTSICVVAPSCAHPRSARGGVIAHATATRQTALRDARPLRARPQRMAFTGRPLPASSKSASALAASVHDVPPEGVTRLHSPEEYEAMVAATGADSLPAIVMNKSKNCKPCRSFNKTYYEYAKKYQGRCDFFEIYGDETKETIKLMMKMKIKSTPNFRIYKGGEEVHQHSGVNEDTFLDSLNSFV